MDIRSFAALTKFTQLFGPKKVGAPKAPSSGESHLQDELSPVNNGAGKASLRRYKQVTKGTP
jgi:hypothetical protein